MKKILKLFAFIFVIMFLISCNKGEKSNTNEEPGLSYNPGLEGVVLDGVDPHKAKTNEETPTELSTIKEKYEVIFEDNNLISGDTDMYEFYLLTKANNELSIHITFKKDDKVNEYELSYDGTMYNYYIIENGTKKIFKSFEYLNYSRVDNNNLNAAYSSRVSYVISSNEFNTAEMLDGAFLSSIHSEYHDKIISETWYVVTFYYYDNLVFKNNKISEIVAFKDGKYNNYFSDYETLNTVVKLLNDLDWTKDFNELEIERKQSNEATLINMSRTLVIDKNGLMLEKSQNQNNEFLLTYYFDLENGFVEMSYINLSSTINDIYARLDSSQIEIIRSITKNELAKDFSIGSYSFLYNGPRDDESRNPIVFRVTLIDDEQAEIVMDTVYYNYKMYIPAKKDVASGAYLVRNEETGSELVITDDNYIYRFRLTNSDNKGITYVSNESNPNDLFSKYCNDESIFYYGANYINSNMSQNTNNLFVMNYNGWSNQISTEMKEYIKDFKNGGYPDDELYNVTPHGLEYVASIYKYKINGATFLEYNGKIYLMGGYFGGYGVTQFAYYHYGDKYYLYYINSWGSGIHRSEIFVFDFIEEEITKIDYLDIPTIIDIEFGDAVINNDEFILPLYQSKYTFGENRFVIYKERIKLLFSNILEDENNYNKYLGLDSSWGLDLFVRSDNGKCALVSRKTIFENNYGTLQKQLIESIQDLIDNNSITINEMKEVLKGYDEDDLHYIIIHIIDEKVGFGDLIYYNNIDNEKLNIRTIVAKELGLNISSTLENISLTPFRSSGVLYQQVGTEINIGFNVYPTDYVYKNVYYRSTNENVVTIDNTGKAKFVGGGGANIIVSVDGILSYYPVSVSKKGEEIIDIHYEETMYHTIVLDRDVFYLINSRTSFSAPIILGPKYNDEFFNENDLVIFMVSESSGGNRHSFDFVIKDNVLYSNYSLDVNGITCDMAYWIVFVTIPKGSLDNTGKVIVGNIEYSCKIKDDYIEEIGILCTLEEAYAEKYISKEDLINLHDNIENNVKFELNKDIEGKILNDYLIQVRKYYENATINDVSIYGYYGHYNNLYVVRLDNVFVRYLDVIEELNIDGIKFYYTGPSYLVWINETIDNFIGGIDSYDVAWVTYNMTTLRNISIDYLKNNDDFQALLKEECVEYNEPSTTKKEVWLNLAKYDGSTYGCHFVAIMDNDGNYYLRIDINQVSKFYTIESKELIEKVGKLIFGLSDISVG